MSISKKGSRRIVVDGHVYVWKIRGKSSFVQGTCGSAIASAVKHLEENGSTLVIYFPCSRLDSRGESETNSITPSLIEQGIRSAISEGWKPKESGPTYYYDFEMPAE
ncbi:hypothetical protein V22_31810 [Calycomorphotria hydatis]|uniref:Uncharacterized protein n=1 Tax=Calycomorphotria hydatis TaxID=2528027 RepID=A0A517TC13_9PLAN|nr:hypothetical protein V22_31810 [Calycomorphotria hydatis]